MSNYPITGRVKRAPAKQTDGTGESRNNKVTNAKVYADGETITTTTDADVTGGGDGKKKVYKKSEQACSKEYIAKNGNAKCAEYKKDVVGGRKKNGPCFKFKCTEGTPTVVGDKCECKKPEKKTCKDGSTPDANGKCTKTETTPGVQGDLKTGTQSRVLQPWEISRINRGLQSNTRKVNLASKRLDKLGAIRAADGTYSLPEGASPKQQRKFEKQNNRLIGFRSNVKNSQIAINSGRGAGELVRSGQRNTGQDELEGGQKGQEKFLIEKARREAAEKTALENKKNEAANNQGIVTGNSQSTGQAAGAIDAATNAATESAPVAGQAAGAIEAGQYVDPNSGKPTTDPQATMAKYRSAYKMTSKHPSIAKLTAGQKTLPQHLQKAIVAKEMKSSNKSRSGFKMRGYGKR
jgi:hypothetical protein